MSLATVDPCAPVHLQNKLGTNRSITASQRHLPSTFKITTDASAAMFRKNRRRNQRERFYAYLDAWNQRHQDRFLHCVVKWAMTYAPLTQIHGLSTDFSRQAFEKIHNKRAGHLTIGDLITLREMLLLMQMWAPGEGINIEKMSIQEAEGFGGVGMFAILLVAAQEARAQGRQDLEEAVMKAGSIWTEIMQVTMEQRPETTMAPLDVWTKSLHREVVALWISEVEKEDQNIQAGFLKRFFESCGFSFIK